MSSTRVKDRLGKHLDFYETPAKVIAPLLATGILKDVKTLLEPSAGNGAIIRKVNEFNPNVQVIAVEIQEAFKESLSKTQSTYIIGDFLEVPIQTVDCVMANPPFSQAEEFIKKCHEWLSDMGKMAFLLRLPFIAGVKRYPLFEQLRPQQIHVLSQRPKFGGTNIDSCDYAWIIWGKMSSKETQLNWIRPS